MSWPPFPDHDATETHLAPKVNQTRPSSNATVRIEDVLQDVDEWCGFTRAFQPLGGYTPRERDPYRSLLAVNRHAKGTPYRRPKGTPFVSEWMNPIMFLCSADWGRFFVPA